MAKRHAPLGFKTVRQHKVWGPTRLLDYERCPAYAAHKNIDKLPDPGGPALDRGSAVHEVLEHYVSGRIAELPYKLNIRPKGKVPYQEDIEWNPATVKLANKFRKAYKEGRVRTEIEIAIRKDWSVCDWLAHDVWARFKVDLVLISKDGKTAEIWDWKTGKFKPDGEYDDQLALYCVSVLTKIKTLTKVTSGLWFVDEGKPASTAGGLSAEGLNDAQLSWNKRVTPMFKDTEHAPTPNVGCRYCPYSVQKGGPCKF